MKKKFKILGVIAAAVLLAIAAGLGILKINLDAGYFDGYDREAPLDVRVAEETKTPDFFRTHFYYRGWRGEEVPALLAMPLEHKGPVPCVIFLHGIGQKKDFLDEIAGPFTRAGFAFASFDQYTRGERRIDDKSKLFQANAFRIRPAYTVNDTRRMIDYLETRPDIATNRIYLVGASYGAITGATAAAFDDRLKAAVLVYGGGNITDLVDAREIASEIGAWRPFVKMAGWFLLGVADPAHYVGKISPRPVYLQNGTNDGLISTQAAKALQEAANEPKTIQWYEGDHVGTDEAAVIRILQDALDYLLKVDADVANVVVS
jgi:dienelactone hydrolase